MEASARSQIQPIKTAAISKCYTMKASRFQKSRASNPFQKKKKLYKRATFWGECVRKLPINLCNCRPLHVFISVSTLPLYLHLILPIQPFYIFITGVGNAKTIRAISTICEIRVRCIKPLHIQVKKKHFTPLLSHIFYLLNAEALCIFFLNLNDLLFFQQITHYKILDDAPKSKSHKSSKPSHAS